RADVLHSSHSALGAASPWTTAGHGGVPRVRDARRPALALAQVLARFSPDPRGARPGRRADQLLFRTGAFRFPGLGVVAADGAVLFHAGLAPVSFDELVGSDQW